MEMSENHEQNRYIGHDSDMGTYSMDDSWNFAIQLFSNCIPHFLWCYIGS